MEILFLKQTKQTKLIMNPHLHKLIDKI